MAAIRSRGLLSDVLLSTRHIHQCVDSDSHRQQARRRPQENAEQHHVQAHSVERSLQHSPLWAQIVLAGEHLCVPAFVVLLTRANTRVRSILQDLRRVHARQRGAHVRQRRLHVLLHKPLLFVHVESVQVFQEVQESTRAILVRGHFRRVCRFQLVQSVSVPLE